MANSDSAPATRVSNLIHDPRLAWAWLEALVRPLGCAVALLDAERHRGPLVGVPRVADELGRLLETAEPALVRFLDGLTDANATRQTTSGSLAIVARQLTVNDSPVGSMLLATAAHATPQSSSRHFGVQPEMIDAWIAPAIAAHLGQLAFEADDDEAFDRLSSLHRLLHEGVEAGSLRDIRTAFAEALFAWEGIEVTGFVADTQGEWICAMAPPGVSPPSVASNRLTELLAGRLPARLTPDNLANLGFRPDRTVIAARIGEAADPWLLLFAEGYRPLNVQRLTLYADLLRDATTRVGGIVETRATWAILQALMSEGSDAENAVNAALREFGRVLDGVWASLIVTNPTGTTLLTAGDRESATLIRPFDRGNRLVSTVHLPELGTMQLVVRRARGQNFSRREQQLIDRAASMFSAWLPGALKPRAETQAGPAGSRGFEEVLEHAASQMVRDGLDVSVVIIVVPENETSRQRLQGWVTDIRGRLRGSDLAGAISDREIGVLLSGTSRDYVPIVCARLRQSIGLEQGSASSPIGSASREAGSRDVEPLVGQARKNINGRAKRTPTKRTVS